MIAWLFISAVLYVLFAAAFLIWKARPAAGGHVGDPPLSP
jgi:hypothetical protein